MPSSVDDHDYNKINTNDLTEISSNEKISRLLDVWSSRIAHGNQIFPKDYLFKDPLIPKLKATEAFCYTLGMDLVLENTIDSFQELKDTKNIDEIQLNINNKNEFLNNLSDIKTTLKYRNKPYHFKQKHCPKCNFKSESSIILDQHLTKPHFYRTVFICNFCNEFKTNSKEEYRSHVFGVHGRNVTIEKPSTNLMCSICDFESSHLNNGEFKLVKHMHEFCQFRDGNLRRCVKTLENIQAPSKLDLLYHEQLFNTKPQDEFKNLMSFSYIQNINHNMVKNLFEEMDIRIVEYLIAEQKGLTISSQSRVQPDIICIGDSLLQNNFVNIKHVPKSIPVIKLTPMITSVAKIANINADIEYGINCHLCEETFKGASKLSNIMKHMQSTHNVVSSINLNNALMKYILPQMKALNEKNKIFFQNIIDKRSSSFVKPKIPVLNLTEPSSTVTVKTSYESSEAVSHTSIHSVKTIIRQNVTEKIKHFENPSTTNSFNRKMPTLYSTSLTSSLSSFELEKIFISNILQQNQSKLKESLLTKSQATVQNLYDLNNSLHSMLNFFEIKTYSGNCYMCEKFITDNLFTHMSSEHKLDSRSSINEFKCLSCGFKFKTRMELIIHEFDVHKTVAMYSLNKNCWICLKQAIPSKPNNLTIKKLDDTKTIDYGENIKERIIFKPEVKSFSQQLQKFELKPLTVCKLPIIVKKKTNKLTPKTTANEPIVISDNEEPSPETYYANNCSNKLVIQTPAAILSENIQETVQSCFKPPKSLRISPPITQIKKHSMLSNSFISNITTCQENKWSELSQSNINEKTNSENSPMVEQEELKCELCNFKYIKNKIYNKHLLKSHCKTAMIKVKRLDNELVKELEKNYLQRRKKNKNKKNSKRKR